MINKYIPGFLRRHTIRYWAAMASMKMKFLRYLIPLILFLFALIIFIDASTYALMPNDPISGRSRGCYTTIEQIIGVNHPTWIRGAEYITALTMIPMGIFVFFFIGSMLKRRTK